MSKRASIALIGLLMSVATAGQAQTQPAQAPANGYDPNERICESIPVIGSRLATKRFCGTRAEWADRKREDREALEAAQRGPCVLTHNGGNGKPAC